VHITAYLELCGRKWMVVDGLCMQGSKWIPGPSYVSGTALSRQLRMIEIFAPYSSN